MVRKCQKTKQIFIARHGQTDFNAEGRLSGRSSIGLSTLGQTQSEKLAIFIKALDIEKAYSSPLQRALETLKIVQKHTKLNVEYRNCLVECSFGDYEGAVLGTINEDLIRQRESDKWNFKWPNGESYADIYKRTDDFSRQLINNANDGNILVLGHETVNKTIIGHLCSFSQNRIIGIRQKNSEVFRYERHAHEMLSYCDHTNYIEGISIGWIPYTGDI